MTNAKGTLVVVVRLESAIPKRNALQEVARRLEIVLQALASAVFVRIPFFVILSRLGDYSLKIT